MNRITWLLLLYQLPAKPSTQRVFVWRRLKSLGALYLQHSACLLPMREELSEGVQELKREIEDRGGETLLLSIELMEPDESAAVIERFRQQSDEDYGEFLGKCADFHQELQKERKDRHFTFAELEENEVELVKLRSWLPKIVERDFFSAESARHARSALRDCEKDFEKFGSQVATAQGVDGQRRAIRAPLRRRKRSD